jgi:hypothetical protein
VNPNECISLQKKSSGGNAFPQTVRDNLKAVLETEARETPHYAMMSDDNSRRYYYCGGMCLFRFWKKYLEVYGTEEDKLFLAQSEEMGFYPTYHKEQHYKETSQFTQPQIQSGRRLCPTLRRANFGKNLILNLKLENVTFVKPASDFDVV